MMLLKKKIILGTVQLGIPYGINNAAGKPSEAEAFRILDFAHANNIDTLDSADNYGEALQVIGRHRKVTGKVFRVINKFKSDHRSLLSKLMDCLATLNSRSLYCYMYHQFSDYQTGKNKKELTELKDKQLIDKAGVSIYDCNQLRQVIEDRNIDIIQLPVNILDFSTEKSDLLEQAKQAGKEIHARSVYLQGLFLKNTETFTGNVKRLKSYVDALATISRSNGFELKGAALNFVLHQKSVDKVVLGIEQLDQLKENLALIRPSFNKSLFDEISLEDSDLNLLNPANWRP